MPELPEVETARRAIAPFLEGKVLGEVTIRRRDLRRPVPPALEERATGRRVTEVGRLAKYLIIHLDDGCALLLHLGMSGQLMVLPRPAPPPGVHDHVDLRTEEGALVRFRDPVGFPPVFFASIGWYSHVSQVREKAREALSTMVDDPSDILGEIIANEGDISIKLEALEAEGRSNAPPARKADVAVVALQQGLILATSSVIQSNDLSRLRQRSALMLIENRASNEAAIPLLEQMIYLEHDINERLTGIVALGSNPLDDAARTLTSFLKYQNERQADGLAPKDYRVIRTTIRTLGEIGSPIAQEELSMVRFSGWTPAIIDEAAKALEKID